MVASFKPPTPIRLEDINLDALDFETAVRNVHEALCADPWADCESEFGYCFVAAKAVLDAAIGPEYTYDYGESLLWED